MAQYESEILHLNYSQEQVYTKLADLNNLSPLKDQIDLIKEKTDGKVEDMSFDSDTMTVKVQGVNLTMRIVEREPMKCIKFEGVNSPVPVNLWIQVLPEEETKSKMKLTIRAEVNVFMKAMIDKPMKQALEKLSEMFSSIPYNN